MYIYLYGRGFFLFLVFFVLWFGIVFWHSLGIMNNSVSFTIRLTISVN